MGRSIIGKLDFIDGPYCIAVYGKFVSADVIDIATLYRTFRPLGQIFQVTVVQ